MRAACSDDNNNHDDDGNDDEQKEREKKKTTHTFTHELNKDEAIAEFTERKVKFEKKDIGTKPEERHKNSK